MRGIYYTGIFLIVLSAVTLILLIVFPQAFPQKFAASLGITTAAPAESEAKDQPDPSQEKTPSKKKVFTSAKKTTSAARDAEVIPIPEPAPVIEPPQRFPLAQEITKGMSRSAIVSAYGPPEAIISGADGQLRERLLYVDKQTGRKTFIFLANGNVSGAETLSQD
jgi:hypothetical protein